MVKEEKEEPINVQLFGQLTLSCGSQQLIGDEKRSRQLWGLLAYLIANRHRTIATEQLIKELWQEAEISNPMGALKNLVYRLRTLLNRQLGKRDYIRFEKGAYRWNEELACQVDIERFEDIYEQTKQSKGNIDEEIEILQKGIALYGEGFLPWASDKEWVMILEAYYKKIYRACMYQLVQHLMSKARYEEAEQCCRKGLIRDPLDEALHRLLMQILGAEHQVDKAVQQYQLIHDLYMKELGAKLSEETTQIYKSMLLGSTEKSPDLKQIREELVSCTGAQGAMWCDYESFQMHYWFLAREMRRTGDEGYLAMISLRMIKKTGDLKKAEDQAAEKVKTLLIKGLRQNDIVSRLNHKQFIVALTHVKDHQARNILNRVLASVLKPSRCLLVDIKVEPMME